MDLVRVYNYCSGDNADDDVSKHLDIMVEERGNSPDAENLSRNLLELHYKIRSLIKDKLTNFLAPLLKIPEPTKYHYWFALFLDPQYVMELTDIETFHQSENIDTKVLVQKVIPKLYEYIIAAELVVHPHTPQILVRSNDDSLYLHNNPNRIQSLSSEAIILERIGAKFVIYQNMVAGT